MNYYILFRNICNFQQFWGKFLPHSLQLLVLWPLFAWSYGTQICFFWATQKYVEILNNIWVTAFYIGMLVIFGRFCANFCFVHSSYWLWLHFWLKSCQAKIAKFEVHLGYQGNFWTNGVSNELQNWYQLKDHLIGFNDNFMCFFYFIKNLFWLLSSDVFRSFGRLLYLFGHPKNSFQVFFFQLYFNKKHV